MKYKIVSFDMDRTLIRGSSALQFYISQLGKKRQADRLEKLYRNHQMTIEQVSLASAKLLQGTTKKQLYNWTKKMPKMKNIGKTVRELKKLGFLVGITSVGPLFTAKIFKKIYRFDFVSGSSHRFVKGIHSGEMISIMKEKEKVDFLKRIAQKKGVKLSQIIAVGDSRSDIPVFRIVGFRIALNADKNLKKRADVFLRTDDLFEVFLKIKKALS